MPFPAKVELHLGVDKLTDCHTDTVPLPGDVIPEGYPLLLYGLETSKRLLGRGIYLPEHLQLGGVLLPKR